MSTTTTTEKPLKVYTSINYVPVITEYSWWRSKSGARKFVIVRVRWHFDDQGRWPAEVDILEIDKIEPVTKTWNQVVAWVQTGELLSI